MLSTKSIGVRLKHRICSQVFQGQLSTSSVLQSDQLHYRTRLRKGDAHQGLAWRVSALQLSRSQQKSEVLKVFRCGQLHNVDGHEVTARADKPRKKEAAEVWDQHYGESFLTVGTVAAACIKLAGSRTHFAIVFRRMASGFIDIRRFAGRCDLQTGVLCKWLPRRNCGENRGLLIGPPQNGHGWLRVSGTISICGSGTIVCSDG